eukprot:2066635-Prorocentrum_lima.AAC.1
MADLQARKTPGPWTNVDPAGTPSPAPIATGRAIPVMAMASRMVPDIGPPGLSMPPLPQMNTPPRTSTPGA